MIEFEHVSKTYETHNDENVALDDINIQIEDGEFVFILGHSGAGKSTFLKLIQMEEKPTEGRVIINGQDLTKMKRRKVPYLRRQMGVVFQDFRLIPTMTVYENVAFAMRVTNIPTKKIKSRIPYVLSLVGLEDKMDRLPDELSGGEQQRVAVARALAHGPKLIIADEPTGNIDPEMSMDIMQLFEAINKVNITVVVVTHEHELYISWPANTTTASSSWPTAWSPRTLRTPKLPAATPPAWPSVRTATMSTKITMMRNK